MSQKDKSIFLKGRGAQINTHNRFSEYHYVQEHIEGLDEPLSQDPETQFFEESSRKIVTESNSPDLGPMFTVNPYQGCEHGCIYCYARNSHEYYGFSAGLDFERKIIVKRNAALLLEEHFNNKNYKPVTIDLSSNTDCYQPVERKLEITQQILQVLLKYRNPVSIITKNSLILRDLDILSELAKYHLVEVSISITSLEEEIRQKLEPRTVTAKGRLNVIRKLSEAGVPIRAMMAPIIPGLNSSEIPAIIKAAAEAGAIHATFTMVRLNGQIAELFTDWVRNHFPTRAEKILNQIREVHGGNLNDSQFGRRMSGEGKLAESMQQLFRISLLKYMGNRSMPELNHSLFTPKGGKQIKLF